MRNQADAKTDLEPADYCYGGVNGCLPTLVLKNYCLLGILRADIAIPNFNDIDFRGC